MSEKLRPDDNPETGGVKMDFGKVRMDLLPVEAMRGLAEVLTYGASKYGDRNWEQGMAWSRPYGACLRHLFDFWEGQDFDPETRLLHLKHAQANLAFLTTYYERAIGEDDRPRQS